MASLVKQYLNKTQTSGIQVIEATPIDDRLYIKSESDILNIFDATISAEETSMLSSMYDGMVIQIQDSRREFIWIESQYGLIPGGYTYPAYMNNIHGQDYGNKTYNLVIFDKIAKVDLTYSDISIAGLFISSDLLPYHVMNDLPSVIVTIKSSSSGFTELEYPDKINILTTGIMIILDPKPAISETFKITVS